MEDGRMNILTRGTRPFKVLERQEELPYPAGEVEFLDDKAEETDQEALETAQRVYAELVERGAEVVIDDREASAGVKFADADLIGYPIQVVVGKRGIQSGVADLKVRATGERSRAPLDEAALAATALLGTAP
jgi:prolyl-tRNA synthetase